MGSTGILPRICDRLVRISVGEWHLSMIAAYKKPSRIWSNIFKYTHHTHTHLPWQMKWTWEYLRIECRRVAFLVLNYSQFFGGIASLSPQLFKIHCFIMYFLEKNLAIPGARNLISRHTHTQTTSMIQY